MGLETLMRQIEPHLGSEEGTQAGRFVSLSPPQMGDVELPVCPDSIEPDAARDVAGGHGENGWSTK